MVTLTLKEIQENDHEYESAQRHYYDAFCQREALVRRLHFQANDKIFKLPEETVVTFATPEQVEKLTTLDRELAHWQAVIRYSERLWDAHGQWPRYFKVSGSHIHSSRHCSRLGKRTRLHLLADYSGRDIEEVVVRFGPRLCRACFPDVPVEWTMYGKRQNYCSGSGTWMPWRYDGDYELCPACGQKVRCSSGGKLRKHTPKGDTGEPAKGYV